MKRFFKFFGIDAESEGYTDRELWIYGVLTPIALVAVMAIAGWIDTIGG